MIFQRCTSTQLNHKGILIAYTLLFLAPQLSAIYSHCVGEPLASLASFFLSLFSRLSSNLNLKKIKIHRPAPSRLQRGTTLAPERKLSLLSTSHTHTHTKTHLLLESRPETDHPSPHSALQLKYEFTRVYTC